MATNKGKSMKENATIKSLQLFKRIVKALVEDPSI